MVRTKQESDSRRKEESGRLVGAAETSKEHAEWCRLQQKTLNILGLLKRVASVPQQRAVGKYAGAAFAKRERNRAVSSEYQIMMGEGVKVGESCTLARQRGRSEREYEEKRVGSMMKEGRFQRGKEGQARRTSLEEVEESMSR